jgi:hypothetical protein
MRHPERCPDRRAHRSYRVTARAGIRRQSVPQFKQDTGASKPRPFPPRFRGVNSSGNPGLAPCAGLVSFRVGEVAGVASLARDLPAPRCASTREQRRAGFRASHGRVLAPFAHPTRNLISALYAARISRRWDRVANKPIRFSRWPCVSSPTKCDCTALAGGNPRPRSRRPPSLRR